MAQKEYPLQGDRTEIVMGLAKVVADLQFGRPCYAESSITRQLKERGVYEEKPISPGPTITLEFRGEDEYILRVSNGNGSDSTGNATKARQLVDTHLAKYFADQ